VQSRKDRAVRFVRDVLSDPDRAAEIEDEPLESYAARRRFQIQNPNRKERTMASLRQQVDDLQDVLDQVEGVLEDGYQVTSTREELAETISEALSIISPGGEESEDETDEDTDTDAE
jgi:hypothetical protein